MKNNFKTETSELFNRIKVLTTLLVVIAHAARMNTERGAFHPLQQSLLLAGVANYIYSFHMPLFIFISGGGISNMHSEWEV